jgi:ketosteroid isomerase-like protein
MIRRAIAFTAVVLGLWLPRPPLAAAEPGGDEADLRRLNADYVRSFLACDVGRFKALLADDFQCVLATGQSIDRAEFLRQAAQPPDARNFRLRAVSIRVYGDAAVISAEGTYLRASGAEVHTRYTNLCIRRDGRWRVVSTQWTRVAGP